MKRLIPAVGYLRRSTQKQEKSLDDQRREIERYAAEHGYQIVRWYQDDGISGDDTERRAGFQAMHRAACNGRDFDVILVWDQDRFGRFNSLEAGYWIHPLMKVGVRLVTVTDGPIDWDDFTGRMMYSIKQEGKRQFLRDISKNTARGQITNAEKGYSCGQAAPYGMDRMLVDESGNHRQRVHNGEQFAKPRSWHVTFVPSEDPEKVKWVRWIFKTYAETDIGLRQLANELNGRGVPGPMAGRFKKRRRTGEQYACSGTWWIGTIREILKNPLYTGDFQWSRRSEGKYHRAVGGEIKPTNGNAGTVVRNDPALWVGKSDAHEPLIDRDTWQRCQEKLDDRRGKNTHHKEKYGDRYLLTGLVFCGDCGAKMYGSRSTRPKRVECPFREGSAALRPDPLFDIFREVSRGDWI